MIVPIKSCGYTLEIEGDDADESVMPYMKKNSVYEPHIAVLFATVIDEDTMVLDIGANYGQHTVLLSKLAHHGKVLAIEPSKENFSYLTKNVERNNCKNAECINIGVWNQKTILPFTTSKENGACSFISTTGFEEPKMQKTTIDVDTIDNILGEFKPDFVKLDVEGSELEALEGFQYAEKHNPRLLVEVNKHTLEVFMGITPEILMKYIRSMGYTKFYVFYIHDLNGKKFNSWRSITIDNIISAFDNGAILIDVYCSR